MAEILCSGVFGNLLQGLTVIFVGSISMAALPSSAVI